MVVYSAPAERQAEERRLLWCCGREEQLAPYRSASSDRLVDRKEGPQTPDSGPSKIRAAANNGSRCPTIAASKIGSTDVEVRHGHAVLGTKGSQIEEDDPMMRRRHWLAFDVVRKNFQAILFGTS